MPLKRKSLPKYIKGGFENFRGLVSQAYDYALDKFRHFDVSRLTDSVYFEYQGANRMSKLQFMNLINDHKTHHRGQLIVYLRLNGIKPPEYMGW